MARPRRRSAPKPRKVPISQEGRLRWKPGEKHALDVMFGEAEQMQHELEEELAQTQQALRSVRVLMGDAQMLAAKDEEARAIVRQQFRTHKHYEHIQATFAVLRLRRQITRLQAVTEALDLVAMLLIEVFREDVIVEELKASLEEEQRLQAEMTGTVQVSRDRLTSAEERLHRIRMLLSRANGWFEVFSIPKRGLPPQTLALLEAVRLHKAGLPIVPDLIERVPPEVQPHLQALQPGEPLPPEVQELVDLAYWGPYRKYRWREETGGPLYTIALGKAWPGEDSDEGEPEDEE